MEVLVNDIASQYVADRNLLLSELNGLVGDNGAGATDMITRALMNRDPTVLCKLLEVAVLARAKSPHVLDEVIRALSADGAFSCALTQVLLLADRKNMKPRVLQLISEWCLARGHYDAYTACIRSKVGGLLADRDWSSATAAWSAFANLQTPRHGSAEVMHEISGPAADLADRFLANGAPRAVVLGTAAGPDLAEIGVDREFANQALFGGLATERYYLWSQGLDDGFLSKFDAEHVSIDLSYIRNREEAVYQDTIINRGQLLCMSPFSGFVCTTTESYPFYHAGALFIFYRLSDGGRIFFLICSSAHGEKIGLYIPDDDVVVLSKPLRSHGWSRPDQFLSRFKAEMVLRLRGLCRYAGERQRTRRVMTLTCMHSIGHYYWVHLNGVQRIVDAGYQNNVAKFFVGPMRFMEFKELYPELAERVETFDAVEDLIDAAYKTDALYVFPTDRLGRNGLADRVKAVSRRFVTSEAAGRIRETSDRHDLRVWITLRAGRRQWLNQVDGLTKLFERLSDHAASVLIVLDGFTCPSASVSDNVKEEASWSVLERSIKAEKEIETQLRDRLPDGVTLDSVIGATPEEKVMYLEEIDFFVSSFGSGAVWSSWYGNKPGVYHVNTYLPTGTMEAVNFRQDCVRSQYVKPEFIVNAAAEPDQLSSYTMDWQGVWTLVQPLLPSSGAARGAVLAK